MPLIALAFLAGFFGCCVLALARHPIYGLYAYLFAFYGSPVSRWWSYAVPDLRWSLIAAVVMLFATLVHDKKLRTEGRWYANAPTVLLILFVVWLWAQMLWALSPPTHQGLAEIYTKYLVLYYVMFRALRNEEEMNQFLFAHVVGGAYFGWIAVNLQVAGRLEGIGGPAIKDANAFGAHMNVVLLFASYLLLRLKGWRRWAVFIAIPLIVNVILYTQSRSAFLALVAGGVAFLYLKPPQHTKLIYGLSVLAMVLFVGLSSDRFWTRMETILSSLKQDEQQQLESGQKSGSPSRLALLYAQIEMLRKHGLVGAGHRGTLILSPQYVDERFLTSSALGADGRGRSSHNTTLTVLVEHGVPGTLLLFFLLGWYILTIHRAKWLARSAPDPGIGFLGAGIGAACTAMAASAQFLDVIRIETPIQCIALLAIAYRIIRQQAGSAALPIPVPPPGPPPGRSGVPAQGAPPPRAGPGHAPGG